MLTAATSLTQQRITRLATMLPTHRAFYWMHLHEAQLRRWQLAFLAIPAPPFAEVRRADWFLERFRELGLRNVHLDAEGNVLGEYGEPTTNDDAQPPRFVLVSAHLDTVFSAGTPTTPLEDGQILRGPGACDNGAGLTALLALIAALNFSQPSLPGPILFAANVGEEGEGNLRGMRYLFTNGDYKGRIRYAVALEGAGTATVVTRALGSQRLRMTITGPGGHSWTNASAANPIVLLSRALVAISDLCSLDKGTAERTTCSPGLITGGSAINVIPSSASVSIDLRSTAPAALESLASAVRAAFTTAVTRWNLANPKETPATLCVDDLGHRPAAALPETSALLATIKAADRHLGLRTEQRLGSTDANLPLSLGVPAVALAAGGHGGGIHTLQEWYDPTGREIALRRVLLILLDLASYPEQGL